MDALRKIILVFVALAAIAANAQNTYLRRPCVRSTHGATTRAQLPLPNTDWNPHRTYRQAVILVQFADFPFSMSDPNTYYTQLLNLSSSNTRGGAGCAADYFRDQSNGLFNVQFDVYGPVKVSQKARITSGADNYSAEAAKEATRKAVDSLAVDFSPYDWDNDGYVDQVIYIVSGYGGNTSNPDFQGYTWANTDYFDSRIKVASGLYVNQYSISVEKWINDIPHGIGTLCHEFAHCLGLPDLYPVSGSVYSVVDEWDLMDGGNFTCWGWNPPNLSAHEKSLLGWLTIDEITEPCQIKDMTPVADGGKAYKMAGQGNEFYLFENRQQKGWDRGVPGKGLVISRIDYSASSWRSNWVNTASKIRYELLHADGMDYDAWVAYCKTNNLSQYVDEENRMNSRLLSTSAFPLISDTLEVHQCTQTPISIYNIQMTNDGLISFNVENETGIESYLSPLTSHLSPLIWYDLQGRRLKGVPTRKGIYVNSGKKIIIR